MRKFLSLLGAVLLCSTLAIAQQKTVSGTVTDENGNPVPFASVIVKGKKTGVTADAEGRYIINNVNVGDVLVVSAQGRDPKEIAVGTNNVTAVSLGKSNSSTLEEVVVTGAFGVKKAQRTAAYSSQVISADHLNIVRQTNVNNALAGKVAGVQSKSQSGVKLNSETFLRIRGGLLLGDQPPIYVVDGTITGSFDINPDDIEDITVLKGANATALLGSLATGGAIIINTKKKVQSGKNGGVGIEINSGITLDKVYILPRYQNLYAGGSVRDLMKFTWKAGMPDDWKALDGKYYHDYTDDASWGPRMAGQEFIPWYAWYPGTDRSFKTAKLNPQPNNNRDFWQTGITSTNNVAFGKAGNGYTFRASYTNQHIRGILPSSSSNRNTLAVNGSYDLSSHFTVSTNLNFSGNVIKGQFVDGYANQSSGSFNQWYHRDTDMKLMKEYQNLLSPYGTMATWNLRFNPDGYNPASPADFYKGNYWYNYYSFFNNIQNSVSRNRFWGDVGVTYKLNNHFKVRGTLRKNQLTTNYENITTSQLENSGLQTGELAGYATGLTSLNEMNYELIAFYNQTFGDFSLSATGGGNIYTYKNYDLTSNTNQGLNVPDLYAISNSKSAATINNNRFQQEVRSAFGSADLEWKKMASLTFAVRDDWGSTYSASKPTLLYPSAGANLVFTELFNNNPNAAPGWLTFGKVFGSWGKKPVPLGIYATNFTYGVNQFQWNGNFLMSTPDRYPNPNLQGALITTIEAGVDLKFLRNRLGFNAVYFWEKADKIPVNVTVSGVSGFTTTTVNAAVVQRSGIELVMNGRAISSKDWNWDLSATFSYLINNPVKQIVEGQTQIPVESADPNNSAFTSAGAFGTRFARAFQVKGQDWGQLVGGGIKRNDAGQPIINPNTGLYVGDATKKWGSIVPKVNGGFLSTISYKQFDLGFSLDYQIGGKFFSLSEMWGHYSGLMEATAALNDKGINVRTPVADGGGVHVKGVSSVDEKSAVDMYVDAQTYFHGFYDQQVAEPYVHDLSYVKLREVSLGYRIPVRNSKWIQGAHFSIIARNPLLIWSASKNFDPTEVVSNFGEDGQFPGTRGIGANLKLNF
jgi:TonB-linked SusC/RagA family outer membrane protein